MWSYVFFCCWCFFNQIWEKWFVKDSGVSLSSPHIPPLARLILLPLHVHSVDLICGISPSSFLEAHLKWRVSHDSQMCSICFLYPLQEFDIWKICTDLKKKRKFENDDIVWQVEMLILDLWEKMAIAPFVLLAAFPLSMFFLCYFFFINFFRFVYFLCDGGGLHIWIVLVVFCFLMYSIYLV